MSSYQNPVSGLMKRAEKAKARNTIPPMIVTVEREKQALSLQWSFTVNEHCME